VTKIGNVSLPRQETLQHEQLDVIVTLPVTELYPEHGFPMEDPNPMVSAEVFVSLQTHQC
jgi:hypothetical protein